MAKATVSGICRDALEKSDTFMGLAELTALCVKAGLDVQPAQVYAGLQSMASTSKCDRGPEKQTWIKLGAGRSAGEGKEPGAAPSRRTKVTHEVFPTDAVVAGLIEALGEPIDPPKTGLAHCFVLLGEWSVDHILARTRIVLEHEPTKWFMKKQADNVVVGFVL